MKKLIEIMAVGFLIVSSVEATTLEEYNQLIAFVEHPASKQSLICEREATFIFKDPTLCIKAAQISLNEYNSRLLKTHDSYQSYSAAMYNNAGSIYEKIGEHSNKIKMYKKALEISPNDGVINNNLAVAYYSGNGIEANKIKAYEHLRVAAKQGNQQAQKNLDILCNESPWACK